MSMISEQIHYLRELATDIEYDKDELQSALNEAAETIESLSAKLQAENMERSAEDCGGWIPVSVRPPEEKTWCDEETAKEIKERQYDKIVRVSTYLLEKYGDKLWEEFGFQKTGDAFKDMLPILKIFDEIYKREKEKYPLMWYEYCAFKDGEAK